MAGVNINAALKSRKDQRNWAQAMSFYSSHILKKKTSLYFDHFMNLMKQYASLFVGECGLATNMIKWTKNLFFDQDMVEGSDLMEKTNINCSDHDMQK